MKINHPDITSEPVIFQELIHKLIKNTFDFKISPQEMMDISASHGRHQAYRFVHSTLTKKELQHKCYHVLDIPQHLHSQTPRKGLSVHKNKCKYVKAYYIKNKETSSS
jgi:predicted amidophosphoribosyltransferase